ncbi:13E12 repeat family protein [Tessaracoccus caeni]|uniref:HNH endonuclease signature motif containing protein n=1 Tax=Tessaracoccus caeni TaxID=3031239 RepID=UPI0023D9F6DB|nr:HNH endonuclease signature motif containing protein [Tessaracoccus caeni]MDF1486857.1 DUF222 domain-containing protein [Tessaracoccus caeni]
MNSTKSRSASTAARRLEVADEARRRAEADVVVALCDLAESYCLDEAELHEILVDDDVRVAGEGTPLVSQYVSLEIGALLGCTPRAAAMKLADALNVKYRHPQLFDATLTLQLDAARALFAARRCADLHPMTAEHVTTLWLASQGKLGWKAAFNLLDKLIIQADRQLAEEQERRARGERGVWLWGLHEGVMNLTGKLDVLDARYLDTRLGEIAALIEGQYPELTVAQRRAKAVGILANPAYATMLLQHAQPMLPEVEQVDHGTAQSICHRQDTISGVQLPQVVALAGTAAEDLCPSEQLVKDPHRAVTQGLCRSAGTMRDPDAVVVPVSRLYPSEQIVEDPRRVTGWTADAGWFPDPADASRFDPHHYASHHCGTITTPPTNLRPALGIAVHIHSDALGNLDGVARIEKAGHITTALLAELLGEGLGTKITIQPVIDLPRLEPEDQYVPSVRMRRAVTLAFPTDMFPYSGWPSGKLDLDHTIPYRAGVRGQTGIGNLAPLNRRAHRAKTAGYWVLDQVGPGELEWRSPLGYRYRVTTQGTTRRRPRTERAHTNDPPRDARAG